MSSDVERFIGIYDADGSAIGEFKYFVGKAFGSAHCALCDLTHGKVKRRDDFNACIAALPVPFDLMHRNDQPNEYRAVTNGKLPCILGLRQNGELSIVVDSVALDACGKDVGKLGSLLHALLSES